MLCKLNNYLSKNFSSKLPYQMVDTKQLWEFKEFDRLLTPKVDDGGERLEQIKRYVLKFGNDSPLIHTTAVMAKCTWLKGTIGLPLQCLKEFLTFQYMLPHIGWNPHN